MWQRVPYARLCCTRFLSPLAFLERARARLKSEAVMGSRPRERRFEEAYVGAISFPERLYIQIRWQGWRKSHWEQGRFLPLAERKVFNLSFVRGGRTGRGALLVWY